MEIAEESFAFSGAKGGFCLVYRKKGARTIWKFAYSMAQTNRACYLLMQIFVTTTSQVSILYSYKNRKFDEKNIFQQFLN